ncbi:uncharacterized protein BDZ99DRAFT_458034 [Mytilinidion resinicola]|uniref:DUF7730 domain-containing protein n=1 Tax=Mytilinidion resinicola TaxID=574789 RepID=A0A6A6Z789_9PEZI|nr:uncharacterized protein BDZ99DRAFT_458034 [Mytilinidion resinicola]KAF2816137.1 hypothetical protein BDZ99DRAFT_458034 [Mytilinidion resinicola]
MTLTTILKQTGVSGTRVPGVLQDWRTLMSQEYDAKWESIPPKQRALSVQFSLSPSEESVRQGLLSDAEGSTGYLHQPFSPLFSKLSAELREIIYREALCNDPGLYIRPSWETTSKQEQDHKPRLTCTTAARFEDEPLIFWRQWESYEDQVEAKKPVLSLPLTCRAIYLETIDLLYAVNTFILEDPSLLLLSSSIPPQRFDNIRALSLHFTQYGSYSPELRRQGMKTWERVWSTIAKLEKLRTLHIDLIAEMDNEEEWLAPLNSLRCSGHFTVRTDDEPLDKVVRRIRREGGTFSIQLDLSSPLGMSMSDARGVPGWTY